VDGRNRRIEPGLERNFRHAELIGNQIDRLTRHLVQVGGVAARLPAAPGESQEARQELARAPRLAEDLQQILAILGRQVIIVEPVLGNGGDRHQRVVHLVRNTRDELARGREPALFLRAFPQDRRHLIEVLGEPSDFVGVVHRHRHVQVTFGDPGEPRFQLLERRAEPAPGDEHHEREEDQPDQQPPQDCAEGLGGGPRQLLSLPRGPRAPPLGLRR
jgi:hypothetical protein